MNRPAGRLRRRQQPGATATFVFKDRLTDAKHSEYSEAFTRGSHMFGDSEETARDCLEIPAILDLPADWKEEYGPGGLKEHIRVDIDAHPKT